MKFIDPDGRDWILSTGNKVYWYAGNYGDTKKILYTFKATSGMNVAIQTMTASDGSKTQKKIDVQYAKYQSYKNVGPTPEDKYKLNLKEDPNREANVDMKTGNLLRGNGVEKIPEKIDIPDKEGFIWTYADWGKNRVRMEPVNVSGASSKDRDLGSFYFHDSEKGYSHGCTEVEGAFFDKLKEYRDAGNEKIDVKVQYPNPNHHTNGGTKKEEKNEN